MNRRRIGRSGIVVTDICMGTMTFGLQADERVSFDIMNRATPLFVWSGARAKSWRGRAVTATSYVAAYAALACYASP